MRLGGGVREGSGSGGSGGSGRSLLIETGLRAADHTFRSVEKPMSDYEAQVLKPGGSHMNAISKALGNVAIDPAHNPFLAPFAEAGLSLTDPKTLAYMRDAKAVVNAAMTTQPRGSDARAKSETVNSMLNAAPTPETIQAVRDWRHSYSVPTAEAVARLDAGRAPQGGVRSTPTSSQGSKVTINGKTFIIPP